VVRQLAVESIVLAALGGLCGILLASAGIDLLNGILPKASLPRQQEIELHGTVLGFALLVSLAAGLVSGLVPGLQASRVDLNEDLKSGGRAVAGARGHRRTQGVLVVAEVALALVLLIGAGLLIQSLRHLNAVDAGFNTKNLLTFQVFAPPARYENGSRRGLLFQQVTDRLSSLPGVEAVSAINHLPLVGDIWNFGYQVAGRSAAPPGQGNSAAYRVVRPGYFHTMQIPILQGRDFTDRDNESTPAVVIINDFLGRRQWPGETPIGKQIILRDQANLPLTVIGVTGNARQADWTGEVYDEVYLPYLQRTDAFGLSYLTFVMRTSVKPEALSETVTGGIWTIDRDLPVSQIQTMERVVWEKLWRSRLSAQLLGAFAILALLLAAVGIYGVVSYAVRCRTAEIGVRVALGATRADMILLILRDGLRPAAIGILLGTALALAATRVVTAMLYGIRATDPVTFLATAASLVVTAILATIIPAWRALRADPVKALRQE
jgi:predicted permease